jgi:hypothetical protein
VANNFNRVTCNYGGTRNFVQGNLYTKEVKYLKDLCSTKKFEMSSVTLVAFKWILICIYRSLYCEVYRLLEKVETLIVKVQ